VKIILGLGNPGPEYARTRHNAGFDVIDILAARAGLALGRERFGVLHGEGSLEGERIVLGKPLTYMNLSGEPTRRFLAYRGVDPSKLAIVHDDMDLACGRLKLKWGGGHGGHNGLRSLLAHLGTGDFPRVRVGVGRPREGAVDHVLGRYTPEERALVEETLERAADAVQDWIREGIQAAMNRHNRALEQEPDEEE
jgi:PTH1 family peptidyl-tRNA hydrolase